MLFLHASKPPFTTTFQSCLKDHVAVQTMASALIALVGAIAAGIITSKGPPDLATLFHHTPNISEFTTLLSSYTYSGLYADISFPRSQGLVTILAPDNAAFAKLPYSSLGKAFERNDTATMMEVLRYHVLRGAHPAGSLPNGTFEIVPTWLNVSGVTGGLVVGALQQPQGGSVVTSGMGENSSVVNGVNTPFSFSISKRGKTVANPCRISSSTPVSFMSSTPSSSHPSRSSPQPHHAT